MLQLPNILIINIIHRLPLQDIVRCRAVCTALREHLNVDCLQEIHFDEALDYGEHDEPAPLLVQFFKSHGHNVHSFSWLTVNPVRLTFIQLLEECCPNLTKLNLANTDLNLYNAMAAFPAGSALCQRLQDLSYPSIGIAALTKFTRLTRLRATVEFESCFSTGNPSILSKATTLLAQLQVWDGTAAPEIISNILAALKSLKGENDILDIKPIGALRMINCSRVEATSDICRAFPNISHLDSGNSSFGTMTNWFDFFPQLTTLVLNDLKWGFDVDRHYDVGAKWQHEFCARSFKQLINLRSLKLSNSDASDLGVFLEWLPVNCCSRLTSLHLEDCSLDSVKFANWCVSDDDDQLSNKLKHLCLKYAGHQDRGDRTAPQLSISTEDLARILKKSPTLESLDLSGGDHLNDDLWPVVGDMLPRLADLDVSRCRLLTKDGLKLFALGRKVGNRCLKYFDFPRFTKVVVSFPFSMRDVEDIEGGGVMVDSREEMPSDSLVNWSNWG